MVGEGACWESWKEGGREGGREGGMERRIRCTPKNKKGKVRQEKDRKKVCIYVPECLESKRGVFSVVYRWIRS